MAKIKATIKNSIYLTSAIVLNKLIFLIFIIFLGRKFGATVVGQYAYLFAVVGMFFFDLGYGGLVVRTIAKHRKKTALLIGNVLVFEIAVSVFRFAALLVFIFFAQNNAAFEKALIITMLTSLFSLLSAKIAYVFAAHQKFIFVLLQEFFGNITTLIIGVTLLSNWHSDVAIIAIALAFLAGEFVSFCLSSFFMLRYFPVPVFRHEKRTLRWIFKNGWPFSISSIFSNINSKLNMIILQAFTNFATVGLFAVIQKLLSTIESIASSLLSAVYPVFSALHRKSIYKLKKFYNKIYAFFVAVNMLIIFCVFIAGGAVVLFLYGDEFKGAILPLKLFSFAIAMVLISNLNFTLLNSAHREKTVMWLIVIFTIFGFLLDVFAVWQFGLYGLVASSLITLVALLYVQHGIIRRMFSKA
ncbi:MAG: oligosaccharide flippase family protein [Candidatus Woesearchaeota archaeon]